MKQPSGIPEKKPDASATADAEVNPFRILEGQKAVRLPMPRGVYRFKTHEEADAWMEKMLARGNESKPQVSGTQ